ncbi:tumor protein D54 isoform X1 [Exaiptasia diaphana]|uniref:Tumor protein D52 n=1 Tax=Exaiptasia diaphana TaxID=2652724 RepID=A0A913X165_EXADI|nr:tumor protein D54 isoform X1 [Exaiptasia diaphana]
MAAVNAGNDMSELNKPPQSETEGKVDKNGLEETEIPLSPDHAAEEARKEEIRAKIQTIEEEVITLRQALNRKENQLAALKKELGITAWSQIREGIGNTYQGVQQSQIYQKTSESLKNVNEKIVHSEAYNKLSQGASVTKGALVDAGGKTVTVVKSAGSATAKKLGEIRDSTMFQSLESKVLSASATIKEKMIGPKPENCDEALESVKNEGAQDTITKEPTPQGPPVF